MITGKGVGFLIAAIAVFWLGRLTQVGWLYLIDAVLWGIILLSAILPWLGASFLSAQRKVEHTGTSAGKLESWNGPAEGDPVEIELRLKNRGFWPRFFISASYACPLAEPEQRTPRFFLGKLPASDQLVMSSSLVADRRGLHDLGRVVVESSAPFSLFRRRVRLDQAQSVLVYPQVYPLQRLPLVDALAGAMMQPRKSRVGLDIAGSRPYFPGDPRRHIHWRNTARAGRPMVKEFEDPKDQTLCLLFDAAQVWGEGKDTTLEYAVKIVASVADYARRNRVSARVWGGGSQGEATGTSFSTGSEAYSEASWPNVLKNLALAAPGAGPSLVESLDQMPMGSSALAIVSPGDLPNLRALRLSAASFQQLTVVVLQDFGEPALGGEILGGLEAGAISVVRCQPGQLAETFTALEQLSGTSAAKMKGVNARQS
ncbi:MAG: DUF58 domain-containing protein [Chloroflexi bacterium]|nr:DUF58 domain-containing protein [Chloroflexota bacterium]MDA1219134.1 DUF58 domain-containing protein [Chloroflexota bacterium]